MPETEVAAERAGRSCPYCRFPLKHGATAFECSSCGALHHIDCWAEGAGCAVVGCSGGPPAYPTRAGKVAPKNTVVMPSNEGPPPADAGDSPEPDRSKTLLFGAVGGMSLVIALLSGILLFSDSNDPSLPPESPAATDSSLPGEAPPEASASARTAKRKQQMNRGSAVQVESLLEESAYGRDLTGSGDYAGAISNRRSIRSALSRIRSARGAVEQARVIFIDAMDASISANEIRLSQGSADTNEFDSRATKIKGDLEAIWNRQVVPAFGLQEISRDTI